VVLELPWEVLISGKAECAAAINAVKAVALVINLADAVELSLVVAVESILWQGLIIAMVVLALVRAAMVLLELHTEEKNGNNKVLGTCL